MRQKKNCDTVINLCGIKSDEAVNWVAKKSSHHIALIIYHFAALKRWCDLVLFVLLLLLKCAKSAQTNCQSTAVSGQSVHINASYKNPHHSNIPNKTNHTLQLQSSCTWRICNFQNRMEKGVARVLQIQLPPTHQLPSHKLPVTVAMRNSR